MASGSFFLIARRIDHFMMDCLYFVCLFCFVCLDSFRPCGWNQNRSFAEGRTSGLHLASGSTGRCWSPVICPLAFLAPSDTGRSSLSVILVMGEIGKSCFARCTPLSFRLLSSTCYWWYRTKVTWKWSVRVIPRFTFYHFSNPWWSSLAHSFKT